MKSMQEPSFQEEVTSVERRAFLKTTALTASAGVLATSTASARAATSGAAPAKNEKLRMGLIGAGSQGHNTVRFTTRWFDVVAVADVDQERRDRSVSLLGDGTPDGYNDYRQILDRDDISVVYIATPDHWHAKPLIEAMLAGKDVYCEKPLTLTVDEGRQILEVQKKTGRVVQVGTQQRSYFSLFTKAIAMVAEGRLGKIQRIQAAIDGGPTCGPLPSPAVPSTLDWDRWLGPAPEVAYRHRVLSEEPPRWQGNCHNNFRWWYDYSGGKLTDWGAHHVDISAWALRVNGQSDTPKRISGMAKLPITFKEGYPVETDRYNTTHAFKFSVEMQDGVEMVIRHDSGNGILIEGERGRMFVNRGKLTGKPVEELADNPLPEDAIDKAYRGMARRHDKHEGHWFNFYNCIQDRSEPISDVTSHLRALNICHLSNIAARLGDGQQARSLEWDDEKGQIVGDELANSLLSRPYRAGYEIES